MIESPKSLVPKFFENTATSYDDVVKFATFGRDSYWKKVILSNILQGKSFLDIACGTGILTRMIGKKFPDSKIIGIDITKSFLEVAKRNSLQFKNISYICQDAEKLELQEKFDCVVSSYVPKYCDPKVLVPSCINHLNKHGIIILHDFVFPKNKLVQYLWRIHFLVLKLFGIFLTEWTDAFTHLPRLVKSSNWVEEYKDTMQNYGLSVKLQYLTMSSSAILIGTKI